jgi:hypothetical protein
VAEGAAVRGARSRLSTQSGLLANRLGETEPRLGCAVQDFPPQSRHTLGAISIHPTGPKGPTPRVRPSAEGQTLRKTEMKVQEAESV